MTTKLEPLGDRILVKRDERKTQTDSGIILPGAAQERPNRGKVIAVGSGKLLADGKRVPLEVKAGDQIIFPPRSGMELDGDGETVVVMNAADVLAVIRDKKAA